VPRRMDPGRWLVMGPGRGETSLLQACAPAVGCGAVVVAAMAAAALLDPHEPGTRALVIALAVGGCTATARRLRDAAGVALFGALVYVGFLVHRDGVLTGDASAWRYTTLVVFLAVLGRVVRRAYTSAGPGAEPVLRAGSGSPSRAR